MEKEMRRLPDSELEVMQALWELEEPICRAAVEEKLADRKSMAVTTLLTLLTRLADKGFVRIEKDGRRSRYVPLVKRNPPRRGEDFESLFDALRTPFRPRACRRSACHRPGASAWRP